MDFAPLSRIIMRYGIGYLAGSGAGEALAMDPDAVLMVSLVLGGIVEAFYGFAKRKGWAT